MKRLLIILLLIPFISNATGWYVSNAGNNAQAGVSPVTAWQTIARVNTGTFSANDTVYFERGGLFTGALVANRNTINFSAYGTGADPILSGFTTLTGWSLYSTGIYSVSISNIKNALNLVTLNGIPQEVGRYPNSNAFNAGYTTVTAYSSNTQITDAGLGTLNWTGADLIMRPRGYIIERTRISSQSGNVINYARTIVTINPRNAATPNSTTPVGTGYGAFVQRDLRTLDKLGEWFYDTVSHTFYMYFGAVNPATQIVKASSYDTIVNLKNYTNCSVTNLTFEGANLASIYYSDGSDITINNCTSLNSGAKGIFGWYSPNSTITNNTILWSLCGGIDVRGPAANVIVKGNTVRNSAMYSGMSSFYDPADANGLYLTVSTTGQIRKNFVDSVGYNGIHYEGSGITVDSNYVNYFCYNRNDGGAIYAFNNPISNSAINRNIVTNGQNPTAGTNEQNGSHGIYMDGGQGLVTITNNTISTLYGTTTWGLFFNSPKYIRASNNTVYNSPGGWYMGRQYTDSSFNFSVGRNVFYGTDVNQVAMQFTHNGLNSPYRNTATTIQEAVQELGAVDTNYYNLLASTPFNWYYANTYGGGFIFPTPVNFANWKSYSLLDAHSTLTNYSNQEIQYNTTDVATTYTFTGFSKIDYLTGTVFNNSCTIPSWGNRILVYNGTTSTPPTANAGTNQTITLPTNTATLTGSGTGTSLTYQWVKLPSSPSGTNFIGGNTAVLNLTNLVQGVYQFELTVTDNLGAIAKDTVQLTVNLSPNANPVVNAGIDQSITLPTNSVTLSGSATDSDGTIVSYSWSKVSGPASYSIVTVNAATTSVINLVQGTYQFALTATDNLGATGSDVMTVTVLPNLTPVPSTSIILYNWKFN